MTARADILAGRAVILVNIQDAVDAQLRTIRGKMRAFTNSISEIGGDLFRGGLAGSVASFFPVKSFVDFQDSMLFVQAKLKDTGVDVQDLEKYIRDLGRTTSFTSKEVAEGAAVLAQAGLGLRVKASLLPALDLARAERTDIQTAGRILANTMMAFNISSERAPEVASKLITASRLGTTDLVSMAESLKYLQTTARGLNIGLDETLALITQLSNIGTRGTTAGTSLNAALGNLAAKPVQLKEKLGLVFTPEDVRDPIRMFKMLKDATKDMDVLEKKAIMGSLFNIRGERAFSSILLQNLDDLDKMIQEIKNSTDEARRSAELLDSRLGGVWRRAKSAFEEMGLAIGSTSEGPLTKFGEAAAKVFQDLSQLASTNPQIVQTLLLIPPAAIAAGAGLLLLSTAMSKVIMLIGPLLSVNAMVFKAIAGVVGTNVKIIKSGVDSITTSLLKGQKALPANVTKFFTASRRSGLFAGIGRIFTSLMAGVKSVASSVGTTLSRIPIILYRSYRRFDIVRTLYRGFQGILAVAKGFFTVLNGIRRVLFSLSGWLVIAEVLILFGDKIPVVKDALAGLGRAFSNVFANIGTTLKNTGVSFSLIGDGIKSIFTGDAMLGIQQIKAGFSDLGNTISTGIHHAWTQFIKDIEPGAMIIRNAIIGIVGVFDAMVASIGSVFGTVIKNGKILISADDSVTDMFKNLFSPENFQSVFAFIVQLIGEIGKGLNSAVGVIFTALHGIKSAFTAILQSISRIPGFGRDAKKALSGMDENAQIRASLVAAIANTEKIWASERRKLFPDLSIYETLKNLQQQLADLDFIKPYENTVAAQNDALQAKVNQIISGFTSMTTPLATNVSGAKAAADAAALGARFRPTALSIGNALGGGLGFLNSFLPQRPAPRGFNVMGTQEMKEAALSLMEGFRLAFGAQKPEPPNLQEAKVEAAKIGQAVKAVVGDFESTRGQKIQFRSEKLQEKANEILDNIQAGVEPLAGLLREQPRFA